MTWDESRCLTATARAIGIQLARLRSSLRDHMRETPDPAGRLTIAQARMEAAARELGHAVDDLETFTADLEAPHPAHRNGPAPPWRPVFDLHPTADQPGD